MLCFAEAPLCQPPVLYGADKHLACCVQATSYCLQPVWLLVLRVAYLLYFAATLLVYQYAGRTRLPLQRCLSHLVGLITQL